MEFVASYLGCDAKGDPQFRIRPTVRTMSVERDWIIGVMATREAHCLPREAY